MYDVRARIYDDLEKYISEIDREKLSRKLEDTENWLYEEGEDCQKQIYLDKLVELKVNICVDASDWLLFEVFLLNHISIVKTVY